MDLINKKESLIFFDTRDLISFINNVFTEKGKLTGFKEEVLLGLLLLRWFKDGKRKDSIFYIGFKYKNNYEKELVNLMLSNSLTPDIFNKKYADQNTLTDIVVKSFYGDGKEELDIHFQIKAFPRENKPQTITQDLISLLEKKKNVIVNDEVLVIYSHYTQGLDHGIISKYLTTYPYNSIVQIFWKNGDTLNFLKLKPPTNQHYSIKYNEIFYTHEKGRNDVLK